MHHAPVLTDAAIFGKKVIDRLLAHLLHDGGRIVGANRLHRFQIVHDRRIDTSLAHIGHFLGAFKKPA